MVKKSFKRHPGQWLWAALALFGAVVVLGALVSPAAVNADVRSDYLIGRLQKGGNYRVRVQAAEALGKLRAKEAVPALIKALGDSHELVVVSAAAALGQLGDATAISHLKKTASRSKSSAVKSQVAASLRLLQATTPEGALAKARGAKPEFLVRVDAIGNSSGISDEGPLNILREAVIARLRREPGVVIQDADMDNKKIKRKLKKEGLKGYIVSGSLLKLENGSDKVVVKVGLNVFTNPEYSLLMMPSAQGAMPLARNQKNAAGEEKAQRRVIGAITDSLINGVFTSLRRAQAR